MGTCYSFNMYVNKENLNGVDTIINDQLEINPTLMCKPMLQYYSSKFPEERVMNLIQLQLQTPAIQNQNQQDPSELPQQNSILPKKSSQSPTQRGILKTSQSYINSQNLTKKRVSFDKAKKRLSTKSLMESQNIRRRKVTMEMLEATF